MEVRDLLILAGLLALGVAEALGEPQVNRAIAVETNLYQRHDRACPHVPVAQTRPSDSATLSSQSSSRSLNDLVIE